MTKCHHCHAKVNPLRLFLVARWSPYKCPDCKQLSEFNWLAIIMNTAWSIASVLIFSRWDAVNGSWPAGIAYWIVAIGLVTCTMWFFNSLREKRPKRAKEPDTGTIGD